MTVPVPLDAQSRAFREATVVDQWDGDLETLVAEHGATVHPPITDLSQLVLPDDYEAGRGWDSGRDGPKTIGEARAALAARIADPAAPDSDADAGAYGQDTD